MVFSTPKDCEGFNHLTRLEEVIEVGVNILTASMRVFRPDLTSIDDTSLEYGVLELRERTAERLAEFQGLRLSEAQRALLLCINWEEYVRDLDDTGVMILAAAVERIKANAPPEDGPVTVDTRPLSWFYFKGVSPSWAGGAEYLIEAADGGYYVEVDHELVPVKKALVEQMVKQELLEQSYEYRHKLNC